MEPFSLRAAVAVLALAACSHGSTTPPSDAGAGDAPDLCAAGYLGDPSAPIELEVRALDGTGADVPLADGDDLAMIFPPQGGRVVFAGVRARNLDACALQLTGALRDTATGQVRIDARTVNLNAQPDGWGTSASAGQPFASAIASYSNVPVCPNQWASTDLFDHVFELEVNVKDRHGKTARVSMHVTTRCAEPANAAECLCICKQGYQLGQTCADAGVDGG